MSEIDEGIVKDGEDEVLSEYAPSIAKFCGLPLEVTNDPPEVLNRTIACVHVGVVFHARCGVCGYRRDWRMHLKLAKDETLDDCASVAPAAIVNLGETRVAVPEDFVLPEGWVAEAWIRHPEGGIHWAEMVAGRSVAAHGGQKWRVEARVREGVSARSDEEVPSGGIFVLCVRRGAIAKEISLPLIRPCEHQSIASVVAGYFHVLVSLVRVVVVTEEGRIAGIEITIPEGGAA